MGWTLGLASVSPSFNKTMKTKLIGLLTILSVGLLAQDSLRDVRVVERANRDTKDTPSGYRVELFCSNVTGVAPNRVGNVTRIKLVTLWERRVIDNDKGVQVGETKAQEDVYDITAWLAERSNNTLGVKNDQCTWTLSAYNWAVNNPNLSVWEK